MPFLIDEIIRSRRLLSIIVEPIKAAARSLPDDSSLEISVISSVRGSRLISWRNALRAIEMPPTNESEKESDQQREDEVLKRLLATPPDHKRKGKPDASPKKRGRPPKAPVRSPSG
jgi:hypothetical protein